MVRDASAARGDFKADTLERGTRDRDNGDKKESGEALGGFSWRFLANSEATPYLACAGVCLFILLVTSSARPAVSPTSMTATADGSKTAAHDHQSGLIDKMQGSGSGTSEASTDASWGGGADKTPAAELGTNTMDKDQGMGMGDNMMMMGDMSARDERDEQLLQEAREEVDALRERVDTLEGELASSKCDAYLATVTKENEHSGMCKANKEKVKVGVFGGATAAGSSTRAFAKQRAADYSVDNNRWKNARDHWKEVKLAFSSPVTKTVDFWINTHNPNTEDIVMSYAIQNDEAYKWPVLDLMARVLLAPANSPGLFVDAGANIGYFTLCAVAMGHRVMAFEPMDFNLRYLLTSIQKNGFSDKITLFQNALSNGAGKLVPEVTDKTDNRGSIKLRPGNAGGMYGMDYIDSLKLDDLLDEDVLLMRIENDGGEFKALDGAMKLICNNLVHNILLEFQSPREDADCSGLGVACWLYSVGYTASTVNIDGASLLPQNFRDYPDSILLTLPSPALPPAIALEVKGESNPCAVHGRMTRTSERWSRYTLKWCAQIFKTNYQSLKPCVSWGDLNPMDKDRWKAFKCDGLLGFDCHSKELEQSKLTSAIKVIKTQDEDLDWLSQWIKDSLAKTYFPAYTADKDPHK